MEYLSEKQKANRAYYARHSERIKAQQRARYRSRRKPEERQKLTLNPGGKRSCLPVSAADRKRHAIRQKIEDYQLARELGLEPGL